METKKIKVLLNLYYDGMTSEEEENLLYEYFSGNDVPDDLADDKDYFMYLHAIKGRSMNMHEGFDMRLKNFMDSLDNGDEVGLKERNKRFMKMRLIIGVAASVLVLMVAGLHFSSKNETYEISETDRLALIKAESAIMLFSNKVNKGIEQLEIASEKTEKIGMVLNKHEKKNENK